MKKTIIFFTFLAVTSCANSIPSNQDDICDILNENPRWQNSLLNAKQKWNALYRDGSNKVSYSRR